jgi:NMD protein affecting ribosome stability and mRNA decay
MGVAMQFKSDVGANPIRASGSAARDVVVDAEPEPTPTLAEPDIGQSNTMLALVARTVCQRC